MPKYSIPKDTNKHCSKNSTLCAIHSMRKLCDKSPTCPDSDCKLRYETCTGNKPEQKRTFKLSVPQNFSKWVSQNHPNVFFLLLPWSPRMPPKVQKWSPKVPKWRHAFFQTTVLSTKNDFGNNNCSET